MSQPPGNENIVRPRIGRLCWDFIDSSSIRGPISRKAANENETRNQHECAEAQKTRKNVKYTLVPSV